MGIKVGEIVLYKGVRMYIDNIIIKNGERRYMISDGYDIIEVSEDTVIDCLCVKEPTKKLFKLRFL